MMKRIYLALVLIAVIRVQAAPGVQPDFCRKPPMLGICSPLNQSWYYDPGTNRCQKLPMGSCAGGGNIFPTEEKCVTVCMVGKKAPVCLQQPLLGNCGDTLRAWYYDRKLKFCKMFKHGLCGSNSNRFETELKCQEVCESEYLFLFAQCASTTKVSSCLLS
ncbi:amblin-like [Dermacentor variabilis]|uniref:amblin-like n=1 Tax=Dermacentor variabilis TaxID=34621 RepID=UPI003F5AE4FF